MKQIVLSLKTTRLMGYRLRPRSPRFRQSSSRDGNERGNCRMVQPCLRFKQIARLLSESSREGTMVKFKKS
jgi:hypothetical protein